MTKAAAASTGIEKNLVEVLKHGGLERQNLAQLVKLAGRVHTSGARIIDAFPYGIPYPDGVRIHTRVDIAGLDRLVKVLVELPRVRGIEIFPKGIPKPDVFEAQITMR